MGTRAAYAKGIELVQARAQAAADALQEAAGDGSLTQNELQRIELVEGDAVEPGVIPSNTTHVFCNSLTFDETLSRKLVLAMINLNQSLACFVSSARYDPVAKHVGG